MADRSVLTTSTFNDFRREVNGTARDIGDIADLLSASSYIASATDVVEAIVLLNTELPEIKTDAFIFPGRTMVFEGATDDAFETTLSFAEPTENRYQFKEHKFTASNLTTFTAFQLKVVMTGTSSCYPPKVKDLRGIALAV